MMSPIAQFKETCHVVGPRLGCPAARLNREHHLGDFLENRLDPGDDHLTVAVKAVQFFREGVGPTQFIFKFAVFVVCDYLHRYVLGRTGQFSERAARDLVSLLRLNPNDDSVRQWACSHFR